MRTNRLHAARAVTGRVVLCAAVALLLFYAFYPGPDHPRLLPWDKAEHFLAFGLIAVLVMIAFPRLRALTTLLGLAAACLAVELVQSLALVHRQPEAADWLGGVIGAAVGVAIVTAWRRRLGAPSISGGASV